MDYADRHPGVRNLMKWLTPNPNLADNQRVVAEHCFALASTMLVMPDGPELTEGLRNLLLAKDAFVRASLDAKP